MKPNLSIVSMVGKVFVKLGMKDKYEKLMKKYPPPQWEFRYIKGRRVKVKAKQLNELSEGEGSLGSDEDKVDNETESKSKMLSDKEANQDGEDLSEEEEEEEEDEDEAELLGTNQGQIGTSREPSLDYLDSS